MNHSLPPWWEVPRIATARKPLSEPHRVAAHSRGDLARVLNPQLSHCEVCRADHAKQLVEREFRLVERVRRPAVLPARKFRIGSGDHEESALPKDTSCFA